MIKPEFGAKHRDPNSIFYGKGEKSFQLLLRSNQEQHNNVTFFSNPVIFWQHNLQDKKQFYQSVLKQQKILITALCTTKR
jgi:hypothetical protein